MEQIINQWLADGLAKIEELADATFTIEIRTPKDEKHGDYTSNIALVAAQKIGCPPHELAKKLIQISPLPTQFDKVEIAGAGFINIYLKDDDRANIIRAILNDKDQYGRQPKGSKGRALVEFVSANPTGPLHIGHGRGAAYGAAVANLLEASGYQTDSEYYMNDKGRQMDILALSVWLRYLELCGHELPFPQRCYQGDYIWDIAAQLHKQHKDAFANGLPSSNAPEDEERYLDELIEQAKSLLKNQFKTILDTALATISDRIRKDLDGLGVTYDKWFSEREVITDEAITQAVERLRDKEMLYEKEGAQWFKSTDFGDEKDRVVIRANQQATYFASDIAYHINKYQRGYDLLVNVWGADHHGYVSRILGAMKAAGFDEKKLHIVLVQFVNLLRDGEILPMSTRSGEFQPLSVLQEVGSDATKMFYLLCRYNQHIDFDVELAKSKSKDNPVYYIQYAYARVCNVFVNMESKGYQFQLEDDALSLLNDADEVELLKLLSQYANVLSSATRDLEPHILLAYLRKLAGGFHSYYNHHQFLVDDKKLRNARLSLAKAVGQIVKNSLNILGASAPERM